MPTEDLMHTMRRKREKKSSQVRTVAFAVCAELVVGLLYELTKDLCVAFGGCFVWLVHRAGRSDEEMNEPGKTVKYEVLTWTRFSLQTSCLHQPPALKLAEKPSSVAVVTVSQNSQRPRAVRMPQRTFKTVSFVVLASFSTTHDVVDGPARGSAAFVGEASNMPPPPPPPKDTPRPSPSPPAFAAQPDPNVWSTEQQHHFMQALMGGALNPAPFAQSQSSPPQPVADDPLANMMAQLASMKAAQGGAPAGKAPAPPASPKPPTRLQKWLPLLHLVCMWSLLAVFVLWKEPQVFVEKTAGAVEVAFWRRWPKLVTQGTLNGVWGVQIVVSCLHVEMAELNVS